MSRELASRHDAIAVLMDSGVACKFTPKSGQQRDVKAILTESGSFVDGDKGSRTRVERLRVFVLRDPEDETYGGIDEAAIGDTIHRADDDTRVYSCTGEYEDADRYSWTLRFEREIDIEISGNNRR